jgi:hypothetical protein
MIYHIGDIHNYSSYMILTRRDYLPLEDKERCLESHLSKLRGQVLPNEDQR